MDPMIEFLEACDAKDQRGIEEHRGGDPEIPFVPDSPRGLPGCYEEEQLDSKNYLDRMAREGLISMAERDHALRIHFEAWWWVNNVMSRT